MQLTEFLIHMLYWSRWRRVNAEFVCVSCPLYSSCYGSNYTEYGNKPIWQSAFALKANCGQAPVSGPIVELILNMLDLTITLVVYLTINNPFRSKWWAVPPFLLYTIFILTGAWDLNSNTELGIPLTQGFLGTGSQARACVWFRVVSGSICLVLLIRLLVSKKEDDFVRQWRASAYKYTTSLLTPNPDKHRVGRFMDICNALAPFFSQSQTPICARAAMDAAQALSDQQGSKVNAITGEQQGSKVNAITGAHQKLTSNLNHLRKASLEHRPSLLYVSVLFSITPMFLIAVLIDEKLLKVGDKIGEWTGDFTLGQLMHGDHLLVPPTTEKPPVTNGNVSASALESIDMLITHIHAKVNLSNPQAAEHLLNAQSALAAFQKSMAQQHTSFDSTAPGQGDSHTRVSRALTATQNPFNILGPQNNPFKLFFREKTLQHLSKLKPKAIKASIHRATWVSTCLAVLLCLGNLAHLIWLWPAYQQKVRNAVQGRSEKGISIKGLTPFEANQLPGMLAGCTVFAYTGFFALSFLLYISISWSETILRMLFDLLWKNFFWLTVSMLLKIFVFDMLIAKRVLMKQGRVVKWAAFAWYIGFTIPFSLISGVVLALFRLVYVIVICTFHMMRVDHSPLPEHLWGYDPAYKSFRSTLLLSHCFQNPVWETFAGKLLHDKTIEDLQGPLQSEEDDVDNGSEDATYRQHASPSNLGKGRWHLAYTLLHNPQLIKERHYGALESDADSETEALLSDTVSSRTTSSSSSNYDADARCHIKFW